MFRPDPLRSGRRAAAAVPTTVNARRASVEPLEQRRLLSADFANFQPLPTSAPAFPGGNPEKPFVLPPGFDQVVFAREGDGGTVDLWDMNTQNETGKQKGRYLYRTHETRTGGQVSVTDLRSVRQLPDGTTTSDTRVLAQRADFERFDGIVWTPWGTVLAAEEVVTAAAPDAQVPQARSGLIYEFFVDRSNPDRLDPRRERVVDTPGVDVDRDGTIDLVKDGIRARPAVGSRSHEGMRFDEKGNLYGISETNANSPNQPEPTFPFTGGFIYKFTPDRKGDLSRGQLFALRVDNPSGDRTGEATWVPLDRAAVQVASDPVAGAAGATGYNRPEDVETDVITGRRDPLDDALYVAITGEDRVLAIELNEGRGDDDDDDDDDRGRSRRDNQRTFVSDYVRGGVNAPADFDAPDNLALDHNGILFITEDPGGTVKPGDDIWAAFPPDDDDRGDDDDDNDGPRRGAMASRTVRFASLTDSFAEPTGVYFDIKNEDVLYVNVQHRGGDTRDETVAIFPMGESPFDRDNDDDEDDDD